MSQTVLPFLPGYMFDGKRVLSTGAALRPSQHVHPRTGEIVYYVRPLFEHGPTVGMFVRHQGIVDWVNDQSTKANS
jgi:hypothetical protein